MSPSCTEWVLLAYRLPRVPSTPRSAVWRKLKRLGVAWLGDGLVALPADARTREHLEWVAEEVTDHGGEATLWLGRPARHRRRSSVVVSRMTAAVAAEYDAVAAEAAAAAHRGPRGPAAGCRRGCAVNCTASRHRDFFTCPQGETARRAVEHLAAAPTRPGRAAMKWATRPGVHVDRAACAWLIRRFIDPAAEFVFPADPAAIPADATPFDMRGAALGHHHGRCSFETALAAFGLDADPALEEIGRIVHEADLADERYDAPAAPASTS